MWLQQLVVTQTVKGRRFDRAFDYLRELSHLKRKPGVTFCYILFFKLVLVSVMWVMSVISLWDGSVTSSVYLKLLSLIVFKFS